MANETPRAPVQVVRAWRGLTFRKRMLLCSALAAVVVGFAYVIVRGQAVDLQPLFTNLDTEDAAALVEELRTRRVPYELAAGGTAILVPAQHIHELRLDLAGKGLPRGAGVGFEIFDRQNLGASDFVQKLNYRRALMGELGRTISRIDIVDSARVHIVIPERRLYRESDEPARASVTLRMRPKRRLGRGQVNAIVHLVSSSVEGLSPEHVTVVDTSGTILSRGDGQAGISAALDFRRQVEERLEKRATNFLERAVGPGRAVVQVAADVDYSQRETTDEKFDPDGAVLRSEQRTEERGGGSRGKTGGTVGVRAALAGETGTTKGGTGGGSLRQIETLNYEVSKTTSRELKPSGKIERLQIAVLLDEGDDKAEPLDAAKIESLAGLVKRAVGFDPERGDQFDIQTARFAPQPEVGPTPPGPSFFSRATSFAPHLLTLGGLAVLLLFLLSFRRMPAVEANLPALPRTVRELESTLKQQPVPAVAGERPPAALLAGRAVEEDSTRAASVLRNWLGE